jgi:hypothetical protein
MSKLRWAAIVLILILLGVAARLYAVHPPQPPSPPTSISSQIYIPQVSNTGLQVISPAKVASLAYNGDLVDYEKGQTFATSEKGTGHAELGFPGQVEVYLAPNTQIQLRDPSDEGAKVEILLERGLLVVKLPDSFPPDQRFMVVSPEGAQVWINSSMVGVQYDAAQHELYADCLKGQCGYLDSNGNQTLPVNSHVALIGMQVQSAGAGTHNEFWQFAPDLVAAPTAIPSATPNLAATQSCRYFTSLGLSCASGFPTLTITPSPTPNIGATLTCRRFESLGTPCP